MSNVITLHKTITIAITYFYQYCIKIEYERHPIPKDLQSQKSPNFDRPPILKNILLRSLVFKDPPILKNPQYRNEKREILLKSLRHAIPKPTDVALLNRRNNTRMWYYSFLLTA